MRLRTLVLAGASTVALAAPAAADTIVAVMGNQLAMIDTDNWTVTGTVAVTGAPPASSASTCAPPTACSTA